MFAHLHSLLNPREWKALNITFAYLRRQGESLEWRGGLYVLQQGRLDLVFCVLAKRASHLVSNICLLDAGAALCKAEQRERDIGG